MKSEFFIDSLEFLDDALLIEAGEKRVNRKKIIYIRSAVAAAACLALLTIAGLAIGSPYGNNSKLLVGKDWRFLREENPELPIETERPYMVVQTTQTPEATLLPTEKAQTSKPTTRPTVIVTNRPVSTAPVVNTELPDTNGTDPSPITTTIPLPTSATDKDVAEEWTSYIAKTETEKGESEYGVEQNFVMAWFASALDMEYVEPTPTSTPVPTVVPTPVATDEASPKPTIGAEPEQTESPTDSTEAPPVVTVDPTEPVPTLVPTDEPINNEPPVGTDNNDSLTNDEWAYSIMRGTAAYEWQKRNIPSENIGSLLENVIMNGVSSYGIKESTTVSVYNIDGVNVSAAVAVKVKGRSGYYLFTNKAYAPETFKSFVAAYNLKSYLEWDSLAIYDKQIITTDVSSDKIWSILSNVSGKRVDAKSVYLNNTLVGSLAMDSELYGYYDIPVAIYKEGYVIFGMFGQTYAYDIGTAKVSQILNSY